MKIQTRHIISTLFLMSVIGCHGDQSGAEESIINGSKTSVNESGKSKSWRHANEFNADEFQGAVLFKPDSSDLVMKFISTKTIRSKDYKCIYSIYQIKSEGIKPGYWGLSEAGSNVICYAWLYHKDMEIELRRSFYSGLSEIHSVKLRQKGVNSTLIILGGDASEAYTCNIEIKPTGAHSSRVHSDIMPQHDYVEQKYHYQVPE